MKLRSAISCGVLALALAGCSGESDEPETAPSSSAASTSPSQEPSPTFDPTKETAKQFIRRWIRISNEMQESGDTADYREITAKCMPCSKYADRIQRIYADGGYVETEGERVLYVKHEGGDQWRVGVRAGRTEFVAKEGAPVRSSDGAKFDYVVLMERFNRAWVLISYRSEFE